jgi:hypothetical protein
MIVLTPVRLAVGVLILSPCVALLVIVAAAQDRRLPDQLDDAAFWQLVVDLSEPDGSFEDENYVSNELGYQRIMQHLQETATPDGVFVGVGPEQNFAYLGALRPKMAFIIDIRRQNLIQHLMYKALFELSDDRPAFLQRLFSRPRPPGVDADTSAEALFRAYETAPSEQRLFEETLARMLEVLTERHRFALTADDRAALRKVFNAFFSSGPQLMYVFRGTAERHPTYLQLMTANDDAGRNWSYLGTSQSYLSTFGRCTVGISLSRSLATSRVQRRSGQWVSTCAIMVRPSACSTFRTWNRICSSPGRGGGSMTASRPCRSRSRRSSSVRSLDPLPGNARHSVRRSGRL